MNIDKNKKYRFSKSEIRATAIDFDVYQPRNPKASAYYHADSHQIPPCEDDPCCDAFDAHEN